MSDNNDESQGNVAVDFKSLGIPVGATLNLQTLSPVRKYIVHLIGYESGKSLLVSAPLRDGKEVLLDVNANVAVRLLDGKQVCAFESRVLYRSIQPYSYYHLAFPEEIEAQQVRSAERIDTKIEAEIDSDFNIVGDWPKTAHITNLSKTGARITSYESLGQVGHELVIRFDMDVSGLAKTIVLAGIIRNIENKEEASGLTRKVFGIQFLEMRDEARLALANYIYEYGKG